MSHCQDGNSASEEESSEDDGPLFAFKSRGAFKRKAGSDNKASDDDHSDKQGKDSSDSGADDAFSSSPDYRSCSLFPRVNVAKSHAFSDIVSSEDEDRVSPPPPHRRPAMLDEAVLNEQAKREAEALVESTEGSEARDPEHVKKQLENQRARARLMAAARVDPSCSFSGPSRYSPSSTAKASAVPSPSPWRNEFERDRMAKRDVKLVVSRGRGQRHRFRTKLGKTVQDVLCSCKNEFLTAEEYEGAELSLYHAGQLLDGSKTLMDVGIEENAELRLEVAGVAAVYSGPPITLKVRIEGEKREFLVKTTKDTVFSAFIENFCAAVGVPEDRANETSFFFDGDKLKPNRNPEGEDMDDNDIVDVKIPADLIDKVSSAPHILKLAARRKLNSKPPMPDTANGEESKRNIMSMQGMGSSTMGESASSPVALGGTRRSSRSRQTKNLGRRGVAAAPPAPAPTVGEPHEVVVLSD